MQSLCDFQLIMKLNGRYLSSPGIFIPPSKSKRNVIVIGCGHNGLICSSYLAKAGLDVLALERRHCVGGAAVTEEIFPGYKFSRASYLAGLLRPHIIQDLNLTKYGFKYISRDPSSFTPTLLTSKYQGKYLLLGANNDMNYNSIKQFSVSDAEAFPAYEQFLNEIREIVTPIIDNSPPDITQGNIYEKLSTLKAMSKMVQVGYKHRSKLLPFYELMVGPATTILDRWFESDIIKTTLATDSIIGALHSPSQAGSAYVLLHHVMGESNGQKGVWAYLEGGMGSVSNAVASSAKEHGAEIITNATVKRILTKIVTQSKGNTGNTLKVCGVEMLDGTIIEADTVVSAAHPYHTMNDLLSIEDTSSSSSSSSSSFKGSELKVYTDHISKLDYSCGAFKINLVVNKLPNFTCYPSPSNGESGPMHRGTIHFECSMDEIETAYRDAQRGVPAARPVIEMTIPSSLDTTLAPPGHHIIQLFIQYAPYDLSPAAGGSWSDQQYKQVYAHRIYDIIEQYCPGFIQSILYEDILSPLDLEQIFGLYKGNIFHSALLLHQLGYMRPVPGYSSYRTPIQGLYMCSAGSHPGGGVMGACGYNCARVIKFDHHIYT